MSRVLVVGPYPPTADPAAERTLALVRELSAAGDTVEVLAPNAGAAHHHADLDGLRGALALARLAPKFDRLVLCIEPAGALRLALRRWPDLVVQPAAEADRPVREPSDLAWRFDGAPTREDVMVVVRERAAAERRSAAAGAWAMAPPAWPDAARPVGGKLPRRTVLELVRPYASLAKRVARRLLRGRRQ